MNEIVLLDYTFMFDPTDTWQHLSQFESDLADAFKSLGFEAQVIKSIGGQPGRRALLIKKIGNKTTTVPRESRPTTTPKEQLQNVGRK